MKKMFLALAVVCLGLASCQQNESAPSVSKDDATKAVGELFDGFNSAFNKKDATAMGNYLSDDGLFLGTDPEEFFNKQRVMQEVTNMAQDTSVNANDTIEKREIRVSPDGQMALVVEQTIVPFLGKIPARMIGHASMKDGEWKIDFYSWNLIPKNDMLKKISEAY
jgi:uncharacterized protein (TIGR02246 family)